MNIGKGVGKDNLVTTFNHHHHEKIGKTTYQAET
jgi:hypothetical protein